MDCEGLCGDGHTAQRQTPTQIPDSLCTKLSVSVSVSVSGSQGSHRSGNSGKILKTFSSQGNQGKTGVFQPKSGKKISNQGTFFPKHFQTFCTYKSEENVF